MPFWAYKSSLTTPRFIEVVVPSHESKLPCIFVLGYQFFLFLRFFYWVLKQYETFLVFF